LGIQLREGVMEKIRVVSSVGTPTYKKVNIILLKKTFEFEIIQILLNLNF
jgi:hypothetical protein